MVKIEVSVTIKDKGSRKYDDPCGKARVDLFLASNDIEKISSMLAVVVQSLALQASSEFESELVEAQDGV